MAINAHMMRSDPRLDLHAHTTASDGVLPPARLVDLAIQRGLAVLAITDHDSTEGVSAALARACGTHLEVWPGVEISTDVPRAEVHVLGYFVRWRDPSFQATLQLLRESRVGRAQQMVQKLRALGMPVEFARVQELAGDGAIGRPHVAQALLERGYVQTIRDAFNLYLGRNGPAYAERYKLTPSEAIGLIRTAGGLPVLAHPTYITPGEDSGFDLRAFVRDLVSAGLVGLEAYYGDYTPDTMRDLVAMANEFDLIPTGGSDFHGRGAYVTDLGAVTIPQSSIDRMRAWRDGQSPA